MHKHKHLNTTLTIHQSHSKGNIDKCLRIASYIVGPKGDQTCDPVKCPAGCSSEGRTNIITKLYKVCVCVWGEG